MKLGIGSAEAIRTWVRKAEVDTGRRPGTASEEATEIKRLRAENAEPWQVNELLEVASAFFATELDRPSKRSWHSSTPAGRRPASRRSAKSWPATD